MRRSPPRSWLFVLLGVSAGALVGALPGALPGTRGAWLLAGAPLLLAGLAAALVLADWVAARRGRPLRRAVATALLLVLGGLGFAASQGWFRPHARAHVHPTDFFHYYLGARYFPQLGYSHLYVCSLQAAQESGVAVQDWVVRDLSTNRVVPGRALQQEMARCPERFGPEQWPRFVADVRFFLAETGEASLLKSVQDHGFNPSPVWVLAGRLAVALAGDSAAGARHLVWADTLLVALAGALLLRGFGARTFGLALVFLGCHAPNRFEWVGSSLLRMDWWLWCVVGLLAVRRGRLAPGAAAWTYAALLRVFPALLALGPLLALALRARRSAAARAATARFVAGGALALLVLVLLTLPLAPPREAWGGFVTNLQKHSQTVSRNNMGLKPLLSHAPGATIRDLRAQGNPQPYAQWARARAEAFAERRALHVACVLALLGALAVLAWRGLPLAVLAVLSLSLLPAIELSSYYMSALALLAVAARTRRALAGALMLCTLASQLLQLANTRGLLPFDLYFEALSLLDLLLVAGFLLAFLALTRRPRLAGAAPRAD